MINPGELILSTLEALAKLLPWRIIHEYEQGVRWTLGKPGPNLVRGLYFFCWHFQSIDILDVTINAADLNPQTICTRDKCEVTTKSSLEFLISDARLFSLRMQDGEAESGFPTLQQRSRGLIATTLSAKTYAEIWDNKEELEAEMAEEIGVWAKTYGIEIENVDIIECGKSKSIRLFIDKNQTIFGE